MEHFKAFVFSIFILYLTADITCKIVLPHNLRYLENMLNSEVVAKAAKIRQRMETNPNLPDSEKSWPLLLAKYGQDEKNTNVKPVQPPPSNNNNFIGNMYARRLPSY